MNNLFLSSCLPLLFGRSFCASRQLSYFLVFLREDDENRMQLNVNVKDFVGQVMCFSSRVLFPSGIKLIQLGSL